MNDDVPSGITRHLVTTVRSFLRNQALAVIGFIASRGSSGGFGIDSSLWWGRNDQEGQLRNRTQGPYPLAHSFVSRFDNGYTIRCLRIRIDHCRG
jgi:hypothetical protein